MKSQRKAIICSAILMMTSIVSASVFVKAQDETNPVKEKLQEDLKAAVMDESITVAQLKEIKENIVILKEAKAERQPGAPVDLMTPYLAATKIRATMATVKEPDRTTLRQDFQLMMATKRPEPSTEPGTPGKRLGKRHICRGDAWRTDSSTGTAASGEPELSGVHQDELEEACWKVPSDEDGQGADRRDDERWLFPTGG